MATARFLMSWAGRTLCGLAMLAALPATAATIQIVPGTTMEMAAPEGECLVEPTVNQFDALYFSRMQSLYVGSNSLLGIFIRCDALSSMRQGVQAPITHWTIVLLPLSNGNVMPATGYTRPQVIDELSKTFDTLDAQAYLDGQKGSSENRISTLVDESAYQMGDIKSLGLIGKDDAALYTALLMSQMLNGEQQRIACIIGMTLINNYVVSVNMYRPYQDAGTYTAMLSDLKVDMAQLVAANGGALAAASPSSNPSIAVTPPEQDGTPAGSRGMGLFARIAIGVAVLGALVLAGFFLMRRKPGAPQ